MTSTSNPTGGIASTRDSQTGPGSTTAGPHSHDLLNKVDPRVDSDLNNRAQYAPGLTASGNVHPGTTQNVSSSASSNDGPHDSWLMNKLDPRVDSTSGNMTEKTTNKTGAGAARAPTDTSGTGVGAPQTTGITSTATAAPTNPNTTRNNTGSSSTYASPDAGSVGGYVGRSGTGAGTGAGTDGNTVPHFVPQGSSTGAPGMFGPDNRKTYDPHTTRFNSSTGSGYSTAGPTSDERDADSYVQGSGSGSGGGGHKQTPAKGYGQQDQTAAAGTRAGTGTGTGTQAESKTGQVGEKASSGVNRTASGIHGAGETLRGGVMSTVDRILGDSGGAERNDKIAREGEEEIRKSRVGR